MLLPDPCPEKKEYREFCRICDIPFAAVFARMELKDNANCAEFAIIPFFRQGNRTLKMRA